MVKPKIVKNSSVREVLTTERCCISEIWGSTENQKVSIARAVVKPGVSTVAHHLESVDEIYVIAEGSDRVDIGGLEPAEVSEGDAVIIPAGTSQRIANIGKTDLVFYCICAPRFTASCYCDEEASSTSV